MYNPFSPDTPFKYNYIKIVRWSLTLLGAWPGEILGERVALLSKYHRKHIPIQAIILITGQISYLVHYDKELSFYVKGHVWICIFMTFATVVRGSLANMKNYGKILKKYLLSFHLCHHVHKGNYYKEMSDLVNKASYYLTVMFHAILPVGCICFNVSAFYYNYKNGVFSTWNRENITLEFSVYYIFPGFYPSEHFIFTTIYNLYLAYFSSASIACIDTLLFIILFQIIGHIRVLRHSLTTIPLPEQSGLTIFDSARRIGLLTVTMYNEEENALIHGLLVECIEHHKMIISFTEDMSAIFGPTLGFNYAFHLVACCLLLLECTEAGTAALLVFAPLTMFVFGQLLMSSFCFEILGTESEKLMDSVYETPWEYMNTKNRRTVCIMLHRAQTPIRVKAMGLADVGVTTMAGILKTTFSYYTFLRRMG